MDRLSQSKAVVLLLCLTPICYYGVIFTKITQVIPKVLGTSTFQDCQNATA